jgi:hypothetical protein
MKDNRPEITIMSQAGTETVRVIQEPMETRRVHEWNAQRYNMSSMQAVIDFVKRKGTVENTVIFYNNDDVRVILDDSIQDRPLDQAMYPFNLSDRFKNWGEVFGRRMNQKDLGNFLRRLELDELPDRDMLVANIRKLQVITEIKGDYEYDEAGNVSVMYKESNGREGLMALPSLIEPYMPILNESNYEASIEVELELIKPKSEDEKPGIILTCPKKDLYIKDAIEHEVHRLKEALPEHLILAGSW